MHGGLTVTSLARQAQQIIQHLEKKPFRAICPCCGEDILLRDAGLFYLDKFTPVAEDLYHNKIVEIRIKARELAEREAKIQQKSETMSQAVNIGFILERIAPSMKSFPFNCNDCRSLFQPIDYVVFQGLCNDQNVSRISFVEIKTGQAKLSPREKEVKSLVESGHVSWDTYEMEASKCHQS